jgi:hypothetical protein
MPEKTPSHCPECSCRKKFTSDSWRLTLISLHYPEHLQVEWQKNLTIWSALCGIEPTQHHEFSGNKNSSKGLDVFPYLENIGNVADWNTQPSPCPQLWTEAYPVTSALLNNGNTMRLVTLSRSYKTIPIPCLVRMESTNISSVASKSRA